MTGTATYQQPNYTVDDPSLYRAKLDGNALAITAMVDQFAVHQMGTVAPAAPTLSAVAAGTLAAATYYAKVTYVFPSGESLTSAESSLAVAADNVLSIASPPAYSGATGWYPYVGTAVDGETKQSATPIAIGTVWQEPTSGLVAGAAPATSMQLLIDAGALVQDTNQGAANSVPSTVSQQTTTAFTAPVNNPRNDIVCIDRSTGAYYVSTGTENAAPVDPQMPANKIALARVRLSPGITAITNDLIDDLRVPGFGILGAVSAAAAELNGTVGTATLGTIGGNMALVAANFNYEPPKFVITVGNTSNTLPAASTIAAGKCVELINQSGGSATFTCSGTDTIGQFGASITVPGFSTLRLVSRGTVGAGAWAAESPPWAVMASAGTNTSAITASSATGSTGAVQVIPNLSAGGVNPISAAGDCGVLVSGAGGLGTGALVLGIADGTASGVRIGLGLVAGAAVDEGRGTLNSQNGTYDADNRVWSNSAPPSTMVGQGQLKTGLQQVSGTNSGTNPNTVFTTTGGTFSFQAFVATSIATYGKLTIGGSGYTTQLVINDANADESYWFQCRYVQASPPYDLGDGEVPLFVYALIDKAGTVKRVDVAQDPPWFYNGPNRVRELRAVGKGKDYRIVGIRKKLTLTADGPVVDETPVLTVADKNVDMHVIPHPFGDVPDGLTAVLVDPVSTLAEHLLTVHDAQDPDAYVTALLMDGRVKLGNEALKRAVPNGVMAISAKWALTR